MARPLSEYETRTGIKPPRIVAWEITRSCNLACAHCRASAEGGHYPGELALEQVKATVDDICTISKPIFILTGGEPLLRPDIWEIIDYIAEKGARPVIGTNGTLIDEATAVKMRDHGIDRISISLDFPDATRHDAFRGLPGAYDAALRGIRIAREHGVGIQVNMTVTAMNVDVLQEMHDFALEIGAVAFHPFLLVPTGRGEGLKDQELTPEQYEMALNWVYDTQKVSPMHLKPTDAPQYQRIVRQRSAEEGTTDTPATSDYHSMTRGCLAGISFVFISHTGDVQPCGYFDMQLGNVTEHPFTEIWTDSPVFADLRDFSRLKGKCGRCDYKQACGGCRARALAATGDYMQEEPYCAYLPAASAADGMFCL